MGRRAEGKGALFGCCRGRDSRPKLAAVLAQDGSGRGSVSAMVSLIECQTQPNLLLILQFACQTTELVMD